MLRADTGVIQPGRDRMRFDDLAVLVLQQERAGAMQYADGAAADGRGMPAGLDAVAAGLHPDQADPWIVQECVKDADRVRAAADTGGDRVRQPASPLEHLRARLEADDALEVADDHRERMGPADRAEQVEGVADIGDP